MAKREKILYRLTSEDFQNVALEQLNRELTPRELMQIAEVVTEALPWYDTISDAITAAGLDND